MASEIFTNRPADSTCDWRGQPYCLLGSLRKCRWHSVNLLSQDITVLISKPLLKRLTQKSFLLLQLVKNTTQHKSPSMQILFLITLYFSVKLTWMSRHGSWCLENTTVVLIKSIFFNGKMAYYTKRVHMFNSWSALEHIAKKFKEWQAYCAIWTHTHARTNTHFH